jgi:hypothetical protein
VTVMAERSNAGRLRMILRQAPVLPGTQICEVCGKKRFATREAAERIIARRQSLAAGAKAESGTYHDHGWWHLSIDRSADAATAAGGE